MARDQAVNKADCFLGTCVLVRGLVQYIVNRLTRSFQLGNLSTFKNQDVMLNDGERLIL